MQLETFLLHRFGHALLTRMCTNWWTVLGIQLVLSEVYWHHLLEAGVTFWQLEETFVVINVELRSNSSDLTCRLFTIRDILIFDGAIFQIRYFVFFSASSPSVEPYKSCHSFQKGTPTCKNGHGTCSNSVKFCLFYITKCRIIKFYISYLSRDERKFPSKGLRHSLWKSKRIGKMHSVSIKLSFASNSDLSLKYAAPIKRAVRIYFWLLDNRCRVHQTEARIHLWYSVRHAASVTYMSSPILEQSYPDLALHRDDVFVLNRWGVYAGSMMIYLQFTVIRKFFGCELRTNGVS